METWEYHVGIQPQWCTRDELEDWLNKKGAEGWELMKIPEGDDEWWYFRKRVVDLQVKVSDD